MIKMVTDHNIREKFEQWRKDMGFADVAPEQTNEIVLSCLKPRNDEKVKFDPSFIYTDQQVTEEERIKNLRTIAHERNKQREYNAEMYWVVKDGKLEEISREDMQNAVAVGRNMLRFGS